MTIHVALTHRTEYRYDRLVGMAPHTIRLRPAPHCRTPILSVSSPSRRKTISSIGSRIRSAISLLASWCLRRRRSSATVDLIADMAVINPFDFFVDEYARDWPFIGSHRTGGREFEASGGLRGERTARELRLTIAAANNSGPENAGPIEFEIPGEASGFGVHVKVESAKKRERQYCGTGRLATGCDCATQAAKKSERRAGEDEFAWLRTRDLAGHAVCEGPIIWMRGVEVETGVEISIES